MKHLILFVLLIVSTLTQQSVLAQQRGFLTGSVADNKGLALPYGTVALLKATDTSLLTGTAIDLEGKFKLKTPAAGTYFLRISAMGFATIDLPTFTISSPDLSKDFGNIALQPDAKMLKEVMVQGLRPTIDMQADKMVVSVEGTAMAAGSTAYEVVAKSPGVWVDQDGNIQLNGKAGVKVMIDGKLTYLNGKQLQTMLQGMPAENLKNLEIIANPSAKYDAEGTSGLINLNFKKNTVAGLNGSVYGGYQFNEKHGMNGGGAINLKQGKWNSFASADMAHRPRIRSFAMDRTYKGEEGLALQVMRGQEEGTIFSPSGRVGTDYDLTSNHSVGGAINFSHSNNDNLLYTKTQSGLNLNHTYNTDDSKFTSATFNAHYLGKLDTLGTTLSSDIDVVKITDNTLGTFRTLNDTEELLLETINPTSYTIHSAKIDFSKPLPQLKSKFETGAKASYVRSNAKVDFYALEGDLRTIDKNRKADHFIFDEKIYAAYINLNTSLGTKWSLQSGLRAEYTSSEGRSLPTQQTTPRNYLDFFPSVFVQHRISPDYQVGYNYSRRINRPRYESLNPFVFFIDGNTEAQGNPYLKPQYTNSFQITQTIKKSYNLVLGYAHTQDAISEVPVPKVDIDPETQEKTRKLVFQQRNVKHETMNATLVTPVSISSKWNFNNNITVAYQNYTIVLEQETIYNDQVAFMAQTNHTISLPKGLKLEINGAYQGKGVYNVYSTKASYWVDFGIKKSFLKDQFDVTLTATDLFRSRKMQGISIVDGTTNEIDMYNYAQSVRLNLRYRFNKGEKFEAKRRNNNLDEVNRAGGN